MTKKGECIMYCTQCQHIVDGERCPHCGSKKLRLPERDDLCFLTEQEYLWSEMLQDVLRQHAIPVFTQNYLGAGITSKIGCLMEKVSFYVPYARYAEAQDLVTALFSETGEEEEDP